MTTIEQDIQEQTDAKAFIEVLVQGYTDFLALPGNSTEDIFELQEDLARAQLRLNRLNHAIEANQNLLADDYPNPLKLDADQKILDSLTSKLHAMEVALMEIKPIVLGADGVALAFAEVPATKAKKRA